MSVILLLLSACWCVCASVETRRFYPLEDAHIHFDEFILKFNKQYNQYEREHRFEIFKQNLAEINRKNEENLDILLGINYFSDLTNEEFVNMYTGLQTDRDFSYCKILSDDDIPDVPEVSATKELDWRKADAVRRVRRQGSCGSCWAFSAVGVLEGQHALKTKERLELSVQQLVDCDGKSQGCCGGNTADAIRSAIITGIMEEEEYQYMGCRGFCRAYPQYAAVNVTQVNLWDIRSQEKIKQLLSSYGPISIGIRASGIQQFQGGVIVSDLCTLGDINHAVLLVGYGVDAKTNQPYWLVKNSWGHHWGEEGYFRMARGESEDSCGMQTYYLTTAEIA